VQWKTSEILDDGSFSTWHLIDTIFFLSEEMQLFKKEKEKKRKIKALAGMQGFYPKPQVLSFPL
jgi:hypothetical protein